MDLNFLEKNDNEVIAEYEEQVDSVCDKISGHVHNCKQCQRRLSFDPVEKALLKTHSVKNEIFELIAFIILGIIIIFALHIIPGMKK